MLVLGQTALLGGVGVVSVSGILSAATACTTTMKCLSICASGVAGGVNGERPEEADKWRGEDDGRSNKYNEKKERERKQTGE